MDSTIQGFLDTPFQHVLTAVRIRASLQNIRLSLRAAGLVALADLSTIAQRTALTGTASALDVLVLAPGIHKQHTAVDLHGGELPTTGAMTTGYVFRVENQAMAGWLRRVGRPRHLVTVHIDPPARRSSLFDPHAPLASLLYMLCVTLTIATVALLVIIQDYWALLVLGLLVAARAINTHIIKRRTEQGWKGMLEPGVQGDLLVVLSQNRWVRLRGPVDDLKAVTSGNWMNTPTTFEGFAGASSTLLVYVSAVLATNGSTSGNLLLGALLLLSAALLGLCNAYTSDLWMFKRRLHVTAESTEYGETLDMVKELIEEHDGRDDWAIGMGLMTPPSNSTSNLIIL